MSSVQAVQGAQPSAIASAADSRRQIARPPQAAKAESLVQEARETVAVTKAEAAKGDQQAIRKLAQSQAATTPQKAEPAPVPTHLGGNINTTV